jgi:hypothetical protein
MSVGGGGLLPATTLRSSMPFTRLLPTIRNAA